MPSVSRICLDEPDELVRLGGVYLTRGAIGWGVGPACQHRRNSGAGRLQLRGQCGTDALPVAENDPRSRRSSARGDGWLIDGSLRHDGRLFELAARRSRSADDRWFRKARPAQKTKPLGRAEQGMIGPKIGIREPPPAFGQPEDQVDRRHTGGHLAKHQQPAWSQQLAHMAERAPQVRRGVQNVYRQHHVEAAPFESLCLRGLFDVQDFVLHEGMSGELSPGMGDEQGRNIGEDILGAIGRQLVQQKRRRSTGARADLEDAKRPAGRRGGNHLPDQVPDELIARAGIGRGCVYLLQLVHGSFRKEKFERVRAAGKNIRQAGAAATQQSDLHTPGRVVGHEPSQDRLGGRPRGLLPDLPVRTSLAHDT